MIRLLYRNVVLIMNELSQFLSGEKNVIKLEVIISREKPEGKPSEFIHITPTGEKEELFTFWSGKKKSNGKSMGGKKPFAMLMIDEINKLKNLSVEEYGSIVKLCKYAQWGTGLLIDKRSKKPLEFKHIVKELGFGEVKTKKLIKSLKSKYILLVDKQGYTLSRTFVRKGAK